MSDVDLAKVLREWMGRIVGVSRQSRSRNPVWVVVKEVVGGFGNWRNAVRGNPKKGYEAMKRKVHP